MEPRLEEVFKISGVPTSTFVEPTGFATLRVSLRTPGRGLVLEGPSGIGKSSAIERALDAEELAPRATKLSARTPGDVEYISMLPEIPNFGLVIIDDFHRLADPIRESLADLLKVLADSEDPTNKLVIVGINRAGESLVAHAPDLANRIDTIRFEVEPSTQIQKMIRQGESALNVTFEGADQVIEAAQGSFYIGQLLCFELCVKAEILERQEQETTISTSFTAVRRAVLERQETRFGATVRRFARGTKFRPSGRGPYLHILNWLREAATWSIALLDEIAHHPYQRISVTQVVDKGYLENLVAASDIAELFHFDPTTKVLSIEDPHLAFYLRRLDWPQFVRDVGFTNFDVHAEYDIALSFAGEDRVFAEALYNELSDDDFAVFYDLAEQSRILARNVEDYLRPIYESNARFVVAVLGETYGLKRWTIFESDLFKPRIERGEVIPVWSKKIPPSAFDTIRDVGSLSFDPEGDIGYQARQCADAIGKMIAERNGGAAGPTPIPGLAV